MLTTRTGTRVRCKHCQQKFILDKPSARQLRQKLSLSLTCPHCQQSFTTQLLPPAPTVSALLPGLPKEVTKEVPMFSPLVSSTVSKPEFAPVAPLEAAPPPFGMLDDGVLNFPPEGFHAPEAPKKKNTWLTWAGVGVIAVGGVGILALNMMKPKATPQPQADASATEPLPAKAPEPPKAEEPPAPAPKPNPFIRTEGTP
jgi:hypothetical protein